MTPAYYNEIDPLAAAWLRELIARGLIAHGEVDERSIEDVKPGDIRGYRQVHLFAGIGGWSYALRLAGWPDDKPIWTASCPCQPFSAAGKGAGFADERHLWPSVEHLIAQCLPAEIIGEQVASKDADSWIDLVHADLEGLGYAFGCVAFPSAGIGAPHIRDRTYWGGALADANDARLEGWRLPAERAAQFATGNGGVACGLVDTDGRNASAERQQRSGQQRLKSQNGSAVELHGTSPVSGFWRDSDWIGCSDGKWRPVEPGTFPLAHGLPARVGRLRGYGNAINPAQAAEFIKAFAEFRASGSVELRDAA